MIKPETSLYLNQQYEEAIALCDLGIVVNPQEHHLWYLKALCLHELGKHQEVVDFCQLSNKLFPNSIGLNFTKVRALYEIYEYATAAEICGRFKDHIQFRHYQQLCLNELASYHQAHAPYQDRS